MDLLVTLFGGGGFIGRYVAQALFRAGARVRIAQRNPATAYFLKPLAGLGQDQFVAVDVRDPARVRAAVRGSDAVVNLVGVLKGNFQAMHVDAARTVAAAAGARRPAAGAAGVGGPSPLVPLGARGAEAKSVSTYSRTRGEGGAAVRDA